MILAGLFLAAAARPPVPPPAAGLAYAQVIVRSHIVIRVETGPPPAAAPRPWRERKGPRCVALGLMAGAGIFAPNSVDLALRDGRRVRARFASSCPGLDFYSGFYIVPRPDGLLCAGRDAVRDRAGGECPVDRIRRLEPPR